jgi:hypothetical protein
MNQRDKLKQELLIKQNGLCAICRRPRFCAACYKGVQHIEHKWQEVNTFDHNHSHIGCNGCEECARGITHNLCNRAITIIEANIHLQNDYTNEYLNRGKQVLV